MFCSYLCTFHHEFITQILYAMHTVNSNKFYVASAKLLSFQSICVELRLKVSRRAKQFPNLANMTETLVKDAKNETIYFFKKPHQS